MPFIKLVKKYVLLLSQIIISLTIYTKDHPLVELSDGVIIDKIKKIAFVSHPIKGIDGISLETGSLIWHSDEADRPIIFSDAELIAQASPLTTGTLSLVSLDKSTGELISNKSFNLTSKIGANISEGHENKLKIKANY